MKITTNEQKQTATTNGNEVLGLFNIKHSVDTLRTEAFNWSDRSKSELYNILYKCYLLVEKINNQSAEDLIRTNAELDILISKCDFESKATKVPNKIVQLVFNFDMDRKLTSKYASVLNKFIESKQSESKFISWLTDNGGINGVLSNAKTKDTKSGLTAEQKLSTAVGIVISTKAINTIDNAYGVESDKAFVLYVVPNAEGKLEVKKVVEDDKFIKPITTSFYDEQLAESIDADAVEDEVRQSVKAS
tara:strand:+ start:4494 stop:5234 length:741 start_codon:yes stop_codon:yes gene_type:complete